MSVKVSNVTKLYGEQKALDGVSFEAGKGQVVGFLGPNGAGKSTMMKIITCFLPQTAGSVSVCGYDVTEDSIEVRRRVGYLPEHNPLYTEMYVKEYLYFIAGLHEVEGSKQKRVDEMIEMTGLEIEQKKKIGALSKGYRQRVGLAQALIHNPEVLILDEPTSGLDPNQLSEIRSLIKNTGREKTVILSTHIMQEVEAICDRVIIINKGKIVADENTSILQKGTAAGLILVEFKDAVDSRKLAKIPGVIRAEQQNDTTVLLHSEGNADIRETVFQFAVENNLTVLSMQRLEQKLEDVFHQLTTE